MTSSLDGQARPPLAGEHKLAGRSLPLVFERNEGQLAAGVGFLGRTQHYSVAVGSNELRFSLPGAHKASPVVLSFEGGDAAQPVGETESPFLTNYYMGRDPKQQWTGIRNYSRIGLSHLYPGIDAQFYAHGETIEHDFYVAPGADASAIAMLISGGKKVSLNAQGEVLIPAEAGELRLKKPVAYQVDGQGTHIEVAAAFRLAETGELRFKLGTYDHSRELVIDPEIVYATYFGGTAGSTASAIASDTYGNVYLTGYTTSAVADFGVATAKSYTGTAGAGTSVFVARFNAADNGSAVGWLTYIGSSTGISQATSIALQQAGATSVFVGGTTQATDFPGTTGSFQSMASGAVNHGFVTALAVADGTQTAATYLDSDPTAHLAATTVNALAADSAGNVIAVGAAAGSGLPVSADAILVDQPTLMTTALKGYIVRLDPTLVTEVFGTYLMGNQPGDTSITSAASDALGNIYVGGYTAGVFPYAGSYSTTSMFAHNATDAGYDGFAAQVMPAPAGSVAPVPPATLGYSAWLPGTGTDQLNAVALDGSGNLLLFGQTASGDLLTTISYTSAGMNPIAATPVTVTGGVTTAIPAASPATTSGFVMTLNTTGMATAGTYVGGAGNDAVTAGGVDAAGAVYAAGTSHSTQQMNYSSASQLPVGQDRTTANVQHGFVLQLPSNLAAVNYIANIGGAVGPDNVVGVALDGAKNAYAAGNVAALSAAYTPFTAYHVINPGLLAGAASAYVAEITHAANSSQLTLTAPAAGTPDPIGYVMGQTENVTYTWTLTSAATTPPVNLTVQIPSQQYLTFNTIKITDTTTNTDLPSTTCRVTTGQGASCLIAVFPQTAGVNDTLKIVLGATLNGQPSTTTLTVTATVYGPGSDAISTSEISNVTIPGALSVTGATDSPGGTVNTTATGAATPNTQASYTFTLANATGAGEADNVAFTLTGLPTGFVSGSFTVGGTAPVPPGICTLTGCTGLTIAAGSNVTFKVIGTYLDSVLSGAATAPAAGSFTATASAFLQNASVTLIPATTLQRGVHLIVTGTLSAPPSGQTVFNLGDSVTYSVKVANDGPSATGGSDVLTVTLPSGFTASSSLGYLCTGSPVTCSMNVPVTAAGTFGIYPITGSFADNAGNAAVGGTAVGRTLAASAALSGDVESGTTGTDYTTSVGTSVQRTATVSVGNAGSNLTAPATVCGGGSTRCVYMLNAADIGDKVPYSFTVSNAGPNVSVGTAITIQLPVAPANPAGTTHPLNAGVPAYAIAAPGFGAALQCSYALATNQIVCSGGNLPVGTTALTITGTATIDANTVPTIASFVSTAAGSVAITQNAVGTPANVTLPGIEVDRAAHLVTTKTVAASGTTPALPINLDENKPSLTPGIDDTVAVTLSAGNTGLNNAPSVILTETLPPYFRLLTIPAATANCTVGGAALTANYTTAATPAALTCALGTLAAGTSAASSGGTAAVVGTPSVTLSYSGKFVDNGVNADITGTLAAKVRQVSVNFGSAVAVTSVAVDPLTASDATSAATSIGVARSAHVLLRKTRNTTVAVVPATFADTTDLNLDEKTTATKFGVNDEVEYDLTLANGGRNAALGVQFTDTLPTYFTLVNAYLVSGSSLTPDTGANGVPANQLAAGSLVCYAGAAVSGAPITLPFSTGATRQQITCSYGTAAAPLALAAGPSKAGTFDPATTIQLVYQGKFQDNAPGADNVGAGVSTAAIASAAGEAAGSASLAVDSGPAADGSSAALANYSMQRAAHLKLLSAPLQTLTNETPLTSGGAGVPPIIAQAEPSAGGGTPVFNCLRYKVYIQNSGPNIARQPQLTFAAAAGLKLTSVPTGTTTTPGSDTPLPSACVYGTPAPSTTITGGAAVPLSQTPGAALVVDADGYFDVDTLTAGNSLTLASTLSYTALSDKGIMDSVKATPFTTVNGPAVTVVNTPVGGSFIVKPFSTSGTRTTTLTFGTIVTPGITSESISSDGPALPSGTSPDPRDSKKTIPLYRAGTGVANYYKLGTTAVPAAGTNPTNVCLTNATAGAALSDGFAKPERVLLWSLLNTPGGTSFRAVPNVVAPVAGDITTTVTPLTGTSYFQAGGAVLPYVSFSSFPGPQSQPAMVCGQVNGFATAAAPVTLAVLEPVNFAPFTVPNSATISTTPGKGVSEVSFLFPTTHDYNDNDPCYIASSTGGAVARQSCDDNLVLTTWIFGGESLVPSLSHVIGPLPTAQALAFVTNPVAYGIQGGQTVYDLVADQLAVPVFRAANFCDPGNAPGSYSPVSVPAPCPISTAGLSGTPLQETVFGSAQIAQLTPGISGGSSGLTILPPATTPSSPTTTVLIGYTAASAVVTAGQTTGFQWKLGDVVPTTGDTYTLACYGVDAATQNVVTPLPAGLSCQIAPSITFPANFTSLTAPANPAIYVVTSGTLARNAAPGIGTDWKAVGGGIMVALLLPLMAARRRYPKRFGLMMLLLLLAGGMGLSGCGSGGSTGAGPVGVTPGTYYFRASGTSLKGAGVLTSTAFSVKVVAGN